MKRRLWMLALVGCVQTTPIAPGDGGVLDGGSSGYVPSVLDPDPAELVRLVDLDADGDDEVVTLRATGELTVWERGGDTLVVERRATATGVRVLDAADLDGDGDLEIVEGHDDGRVLVRFEDDAITELPRDCDPTPGDAVTHLASSDLDGDGRVDVLVAKSNALFAVLRPSSGDVCAFAVAGARGPVARLALDEAREAFAASHDDGVIVWEWSAEGPRRLQTFALTEVRDLASGDVTADAAPELVIATSAGVRIFANEGGVLASAPGPELVTTPRRVRVDDLDGDGSAEVIEADGESVRAWKLAGRSWSLVAQLPLTSLAFDVGRTNLAAPTEIVTSDDAVRLWRGTTGTASCPDRDGDGHRDVRCGGDDCDDAAAHVHPGAPLVCGNGVRESCDADRERLDATRTRVFGGAGEVAVTGPFVVASSSADGALSEEHALVVDGDGRLFVSWVSASDAPIALSTVEAPARRRSTLSLRDVSGGETLRAARDVALGTGGVSASNRLVTSILANASDDDLVFGFACDREGIAANCVRLSTGAPADRQNVWATDVTGGDPGAPPRRLFLNRDGEVGTIDETASLASYVSVMASPLTSRWHASRGRVVALGDGSETLQFHRTGDPALVNLLPSGYDGGAFSLAHLGSERYALTWNVGDRRRTDVLNCTAGCALEGVASDGTPTTTTVRELRADASDGLVAFATTADDAVESSVLLRMSDTDLSPLDELVLLRSEPGSLRATAVYVWTSGTGADRELAVWVSVVDGASDRDRAIRVVGLRGCATP
ncbi:MAG: putative metal-binding motif-containing protein [Sandaracinus sp.]|nr:putative metal-binding motif-containing protein [Sandaracinus sp.]MCB9630718.1 putative metal-binding motif-containing protein [Sandaracinus sp.]